MKELEAVFGFDTVISNVCPNWPLEIKIKWLPIDDVILDCGNSFECLEKFECQFNLNIEVCSWSILEPVVSSHIIEPTICISSNGTSMVTIPLVSNPEI